MGLRERLSRLPALGRPDASAVTVPAASETAPVGADAFDGVHVERTTPVRTVGERAHAECAGFDAPGSDRTARVAQLRALIGEVAARGARVPVSSSRRVGPQTLPVGEQRSTVHGPLHVVERWLEPSACHGRVPVAGALGVDASHVAALARDPALAGVELRRMLILDTETTGLSGGTGTVPFLVGLAYFEGVDDAADRGALGGGGVGAADAGVADGAPLIAVGCVPGQPVLKVEQLFLPNLGDEAPLLHHLAQRIAAASVLVTYNGKAFDWPLLRTRFMLARIAVPTLPPHLDLLHCARRLFAGSLESVRLTEVERSVLGFHREDDVPGSEIPALYLAYLRGEDPRALLPVLTHNEHDVIALSALLARLCQPYADAQAGGNPHEQLACAKLALLARDHLRARVLCEGAVAGAHDTQLRQAALGLRARLQHRAGDVAGAVESYEQALGECTVPLQRAQLHLSLSRLHERMSRDLSRAYHHARSTEPVEGPAAQGRRIGRLHRRMLRASP